MPPTIVGAMTYCTGHREQRPVAGEAGQSGRRGRVRQGAARLLVMWLAAAGASRAAPPPASNQVARLTDASIWKVVKADEMDTTACLSRDKTLIEEPGNKWKHAQTEHFVIHYEMELFALKVAHMAEFFYSYIPQDLQGSRDQTQGRSHLFIFRTEHRWKNFLESQSDQKAWVYSFVHGPSLYLQQADTRNKSADVLAHEMTHLVINRFIHGGLPLWLNEGVAEYYGEFANAAFRGTTRNPRLAFRSLREAMDLRTLLATAAYPGDNQAVHRFYQSSKYFVGFLLTKKPRDKFPAFLAAVAAGKAPEEALQEHYGFSDLKEVEKEFARFTR
ncbi:MAG: hypothetical protein NTV49_11025 [Kiritimatiellaeota bacterium]|nr:hypothetical protein [Kiritimatiellota bacterium]